MTENLTKTLNQRLEEYFEAKIVEGYQIVDKELYSKLRKMVMQDLKLGDGHYGVTNKALNQILKEKNLSVVGRNPSGRVGSFQINVPPFEKKVVTELPKDSTTEKVIIPSQELTTKEQSQIPPQTPEEILKNNQEAFREVFLFVEDIFGALSVIKGKDTMKIEEMTTEQFHDRSQAYAERMGGFCYRHGIKVPVLIEVLGLVGTGIALLIIPLIHTFYMKTEAVKELGKDTKKG